MRLKLNIRNLALGALKDTAQLLSHPWVIGANTAMAAVGGVFVAMDYKNMVGSSVQWGAGTFLFSELASFLGEALAGLPFCTLSRLQRPIIRLSLPKANAKNPYCVMTLALISTFGNIAAQKVAAELFDMTHPPIHIISKDEFAATPHIGLPDKMPVHPKLKSRTPVILVYP